MPSLRFSLFALESFHGRVGFYSRSERLVSIIMRKISVSRVHIYLGSSEQAGLRPHSHPALSRLSMLALRVLWSVETGPYLLSLILNGL